MYYTVEYTFYAVKGCNNNRNDNTAAAPGYGSLVPHAVNYTGAILSENGVLLINDKSTDPFSVAINVFKRNLSFEVPGHNSILIYPDIGMEILHSEKEDAPGTGTDTLIQISCTDTTSTASN